MSARPVFIGGTSSNAGKSWMVTAICSWLRAKGVSVAPFKAQNMSNNSYPCATGGEIGRAQVAQAEACGLLPEPAMNPILLKPSGDGVSQVIVLGRVWQSLTAREYYACSDVLRTYVLGAYHDLANRFDVIVIEGAGSVSELNLRQHDLVNLALVTAIRAPWLLVADIERGGVFASIVGTSALLSAEERKLWRGFMINKFRGDVTLFDSAVPMLESKTEARCFGVFPFADDIQLDAEDSLALVTDTGASTPRGVRLAIVRLPCLSNSTDFRLLGWADWLSAPGSGQYDFIVLPGSKNSIHDLRWLRSVGLADWIVAQHRAGATVVGICGGYQMMGASIDDPHGMETTGSREDGLGMLPTATVLTSEKRTRAVSARLSSGAGFEAYEIHLGITTFAQDPPKPFARLDDGSAEGIWEDRLIGTYLHGAFEDAGVCRAVFGVEIPGVEDKATHYSRLAAWFDQHQRHFGELGLV
jgi:adenosylcobyric acid synthase